MRDHFNLRTWDHGLVSQELLKHHITPRKLSPNEVEAAQGLIVPASSPGNNLAEGTFSGTAKALTEVYRRIETRFQSFFDVLGISPSIPFTQGLSDKRLLYDWSPQTGPDADKFPPHLSLIPPGPDSLSVFQIFDTMRLLDTGFVLASIIPQSLKDFVYCRPSEGATMASLDQSNRRLRMLKKNIYEQPNVGDCIATPWHTDESFGQQQLTGANPATLEIASSQWISEFKQEARMQGKVDMERLILDGAESKSLYVQDCSYFRAAIGAHPLSDLSADSLEEKYACASVTLFVFTPRGRLHPCAIVIDYKQDMENSVVVFNKRLDPDETKVNQASDWPWRYAKTCASSADWVRHELSVHLVDCHFVEEATIVAAHRSFPSDHLVYRCLEPHWLKTLPLNAAARSTLVPHVVVPVIGLNAEHTYAFIRDAYKRFDWVGHYVPNHLEKRGFPISELQGSPKFHNYAYGQEIVLMWDIIRKFVKAFLVNGGHGFANDESVASDDAIAHWCAEMQSTMGGQMESWPTIKTVNQLVDCVTMCIHIASPQHTAVNYLQEFYNAYVVNRPPAICSPLPKSLSDLEQYTEKQLMDALPINRPNEWLLASHLVHLLSYKVAEDQNLVNYGVSLYHLTETEPALHSAANDFVLDLLEFDLVLQRIGRNLTDTEVGYDVLKPITNAVSILI